MGNFNENPPYSKDAEMVERLTAALELAEQEKAKLYHELNRRIEKYHDLFMKSLIRIVCALEKKLNFLEGHSHRVAEMACAVLWEMQHDSPSERESLRIAALLHDIGKIGIPEHILCKKGALTALERRIVEAHPEKGAELLQDMTELEEVSRAIRYHHERWDGRGYPAGLGGGDIPLAARIIAVCDAFDAMTAVRPYRQTVPAGVARDELLALSGTAYDPSVIAAFVRCFDAGYIAPCSLRE